jgi:outer membrane protein assembly factor BamA
MGGGRNACAGLFCCMLLATVSAGQVPRRLQDCLPIPTLAQDIEQRRADAERREPSNQETPQTHIKLVSLDFRGQTALAPEELTQIARALEAHTYVDDPRWLEELAARIQDAFQQRGFFKSLVEEPRSRQLAGTPIERRFAVSMSVDAGARYRLNRIDFRNSTQFSYDKLRAFLPIYDGDLFDTHAIQGGLENLRKAYGVKGFLNFSMVPSFNIDEPHALITLILDLAEDKPFRLGQVKILGFSPALAQKLLQDSGLAPGAIFDASLVDKFFESNKLILPKDADPVEDTHRLINEGTGTVDITMNFRMCPVLSGR